MWQSNWDRYSEKILFMYKIRISLRISIERSLFSTSKLKKKQRRNHTIRYTEIYERCSNPIIQRMVKN